ncbi:MAG: hypothetical protein NZ749_05925, partial [bacterium]|nr:hypothetical protein [bacterium]
MGAQAGISAIRRDALTWGITAGVALTAGIALLLVPVELVFGAVAALVAGSVFLVSPYAGALAFIALYYMRPMDFFPQLALLRIPLFIASITSTGLFVRLLLARQKLVEGWYVKWFLALWGAMLLSVPLSLYRSQSFSGAQDFLKSVAMVWMIYMAVRSEKQITFAVRMLGWMA